MLAGPALLLLACLHMRVQGKPRSQVGAASPPLGPGGTWDRVGIPIDALKTLAVRAGLLLLELVLVFVLDFLCREVLEAVDVLLHACHQEKSCLLKLMVNTGLAETSTSMDADASKPDT